VVSEEEHLQALVAQSGDHPVLRDALSGSIAVKDTVEAAAVRVKVDQLVREAERGGLVGAAQATEVRQALGQRVNTSFGTRAEESALDVYERRTGNTVRGRNDERMSLDFGAFRVVGMCDGIADEPHFVDRGGGGGRGGCRSVGDHICRRPF
jgi:hypothetical protein